MSGVPRGVSGTALGGRSAFRPRSHAAQIPIWWGILVAGRGRPLEVEGVSYPCTPYTQVFADAIDEWLDDLPMPWHGAAEPVEWVPID
jgi:hypothetical protein